MGVEFVYEALKTDPAAASAAAGRKLRFLANVDPIDVSRAWQPGGGEQPAGARSLDQTRTWVGGLEKKRVIAGQKGTDHKLESIQTKNR